MAMKEGWDIKPFGEIAEFVSGSRPQGGVGQIKSGVLSLGGEHVGINGYVDISTPKFVPQEYYDANPKGHIQSGDILLCKDGALSGKVAIERGELSGKESMVNEHVFIIRTDKIDQKYLFFYLFSPVGQSLLKGIVTGAAQGGINGKNLRSIPVVFPLAIEEQQRIVSELDLLSGVISRKQAQLRDLNTLAHSIFYDMFGDVNYNPNGYETISLGDRCEFIKDGTHQTPEYTEDTVNGYKFLSAKDVVGGEINWSKIKYIPASLHAELYKRIAPKRNDILLCKNGTTGIAAIVDTDEIFDIYVSLALLRPKSPYCPEFLLYAINNPATKEQFDRSLKGVGVPNLHLGEIKKTVILNPPMNKQEEFKKKIDVVCKNIETFRKSLSDTELLLESRMGAYFND